MQDLAVPSPTTASCSYRPPVSSCLCLAGPEAVFDPGSRLSPHLLLRCFICILHLCGNLGWTPKTCTPWNESILTIGGDTAVGVRHVHLSSSVPVQLHSESLLSELDPLELLLADSEELLLLSLDGPPEGAEPDFSFLVGFLLFSCPLTSCSRFSSSFFFS